jgi:stress response protein YsnF
MVEVRVRKERITEQRAAEADIRKEEVDVEGDNPRGLEGDFSRSRPVRRDPDRDDDLP